MDSFACGVVGGLQVLAEAQDAGQLFRHTMSLLEGDMATPMLKWRTSLNFIMALSDLRHLSGLMLQLAVPDFILNGSTKLRPLPKTVNCDCC